MKAAWSGPYCSDAVLRLQSGFPELTGVKAGTVKGLSVMNKCAGVFCAAAVQAFKKALGSCGGSIN